MKDKVFVSKDAEGKEVELKFVVPNRKVRSDADFIQKKAYSEAMRAGFLSEAEATRLLKERGVWSEKEQEQEAEIRSEIADLEVELESCDDEERGREVCMKIKSLRIELNKLRSIFTSATNSTSETHALENKYEFLASTCVVYNKTGKRVFKDVNEYRDRLEEPLAIEAYNQAMIYTYEMALNVNLDDLLNAPLPEDKWTDEHPVKVEEKQEEKSELVKKKRRTRKKKTAQ